MPAGTRAALVGYPLHENVGDAALWLGLRRELVHAGVAIVYECAPETYDPSVLRRALRDDDVILLSGGGNFGDLWYGQQQLREAVLRDFSTIRTIQLPQSVWFDDPANVERMRRLLESHADVTLLVRDRQSLALAQGAFAVPVHLCPDGAFALGALRRPEAPTAPVLFLRRTDKESRGWDPVSLPDRSEVGDWLGRDDVVRLDAAGQAARTAIDSAVATSSPAVDNDDRWKALRRRFLPLARSRLLRGCRILSRGEVVVTDRLHGHVLALLLGIPHVVLDNSYGKVAGFVDTWTAPSPLVHRAATSSEATELVAELLADRAGIPA